MIGRTILHYRIVEELGRGGMGVVYRAEDEKLKRPVAIKFLPREVANVEDARKRFEIEAQSAAALNHPNIATIHAIESVDDQTFIVMEYIEGQELKTLIEDATLTSEGILTIAEQIASGLKKAHEKSIVHRDIKSANIMIASGGEVKVMDFGLAKMQDNPQLTEIGSTLGTAAYMSPEQAQGKPVDARTDIWSFGVVLYEMLTGQLPFGDTYSQAIIYSILNEAHPALPAEKITDAARLQGIIDRCLAKDPAERYANFDQLLADLKNPIVSNPSTSAAEKTDHQDGTARRSLVFPIIVAILSVVAVALYLMRGKEKAPESNVRIPVAIADFLNHTGETELDALSGMMITSLEQSRKLAVMSRSRMFDVLQQIGQAEATVVDENLGREICRHANIQALILPSIRKFGKVYSIDLKVLDPQSGEYRFTLSARDEGQEAIPGIIDRLSAEARQQLRENEAEIIAATQQVAEVTTPNLEAYQYYFQGEALLDKLKLREAIAAFDKAIALDSTFGLAYYRKAYAMGWFLETLWDAPLKKALKYIDQMPEKERLRLRAEEIRLEEGMGAAMLALQEMEKNYPDDKEMLLNIGDLAFHSRQLDIAFIYFQKVLKLDPDNQRARFHYREVVLGYYTRPQYFANDTSQMALAIEEALKAAPNDILLNTARATAKFMQKDYNQAENILSETLDIASTFHDTTYVWKAIASLLAARGKLQAAMDTLDKGIALAAKKGMNTALYEIYLDKCTLLGTAMNDREQLVETVDYLKRNATAGQIIRVPFFWELVAINLTRVGEEKMITAINDKFHTRSKHILPVILGALGGNCENLNALIESVIRKDERSPDYVKGTFILMLAECYWKTGAYSLAEQAIMKSREWHLLPIDPLHQTPYLQSKSYWWLGDICEKTGRPQEAIRHYRHFLELWGDGDAGIPEVVDATARLQRLENAL